MPRAIVSGDSFRAQIRATLEEDPALVRSVLRECLGSDTQRMKATCPRCKNVFAHEGPDYATRINALKIAVELGYGRTPQAEPPAPSTSVDMERLELLSDEQLLALLGDRPPPPR